MGAVINVMASLVPLWFTTFVTNVYSLVRLLQNVLECAWHFNWAFSKTVAPTIDITKVKYITSGYEFCDCRT
jgi:hypothetical protein